MNSCTFSLDFSARNWRLNCIRDLPMKGRLSSAAGVKQAMAILAILAVVAVGGCLLDRDADGTGDEAMDLCVAAVAAIVALPVLVAILGVGWPMSAIANSVSIVIPPVPDPPPKFLLLV